MTSSKNTSADPSFDEHEYGPDTTVSTSTDCKVLMEATSSTPTAIRQEAESMSTVDQHLEVDYQQPSSSSNLGNSPSRSQIIDGPSETESNISNTASRKINAHFCEFIDQIKGQCKQRAINNFKYCIRHILLDPNAPYKQCQHQRKPKNKHEKPLLCTNAIRSSCPEIYCSTHLIMNGLKDPKVNAKKEKIISKGSKKVDQNEEKTLSCSQLSSSISSSHQIIAGNCLEQQLPSSYPEFNAGHYAHVSSGSDHHVDIGFNSLNEALPSATTTSNSIADKNILDQNEYIRKSDAYLNSQNDGFDHSRLSYKHSNALDYENNQKAYSSQEANTAKIVAGNHFTHKRPHMNDDLPMCNLSKTHPQLAAKLLQSKTHQLNQLDMMQRHLPEKAETSSSKAELFVKSNVSHNEQVQVHQGVHIHEHFPRGTVTSYQHPSQFAYDQQKIFFVDRPLSAKYIIKGNQIRQEPLVESSIYRTPRIMSNNREFVQPPYTNYITSSLTFLNSNPPPRRYDMNRLEREADNVIMHENSDPLLGFQREKNAVTSASSRIRQQKVIKLRQKRQKVRIDGSFRSIPTVDSMCRIVESQDFDRTDLFPLGLEPSDDESSDDSFPSLGEDSCYHASSIIASDNRPSSNRLELYLLKKQLRLESSRLVQRAKLCVPINTAAREYKNSVGAALRVRKNNIKKENQIGEYQNRLFRCSYVSQQEIMKETKVEFVNVRCTNMSLPWARHCTDHITYNIAQHLFSYCKWRLCNAPVSIADTVLFDGLCRQHYSLQQQQQQHGGTEHNNSTSTSSRNMKVHMVQGHEFLEKKTHLGQPYRPCDASSTSHSDPFESTSVQFGSNVMSLSRDDHLNDHVDVSLASVAKDLGFDGRDLTDMLAKLPVEDGFEGDMDPDDDNLLNINKDDSDEAPPGVTLGHSWADVEQFLLEQEEGLNHPIHELSSPFNSK